MSRATFLPVHALSHRQSLSAGQALTVPLLRVSVSHRSGAVLVDVSSFYSFHTKIARKPSKEALRATHSLFTCSLIGNSPCETNSQPGYLCLFSVLSGTIAWSVV